MKLVCNGNDLADAVGKVYKAVSNRTSNPILEGIKLTAQDGSLTLLATDLELAIEKVIVADVKIDGETVVPGRFFSEFVKKLTKEEIELVVSDRNNLKIRYTDSEGVLSCSDAEDYPEINSLGAGQTFVIKSEDFKDLINKIAFSVSTDDSRPILKGVLLEISEENVTGVALDGYRLARSIKPVVSTTAQMSAIVPARCLVEIARLLDDSDEPVSVTIQKNYLMVNLGHTKITSRLLDGDFINYKQIIPASFNTEVTLSKERFESGLERAILLARADKNNLVRFDIKENYMQLSSNCDSGNIVEKIVTKMDGQDLAIAFNARYYMELLRFVDSETITIRFTDQVSPCVVVPSDGKEDFMYLVLPVRLLD